MSYATLMVHLDHEQSNDAKLEVAGQLAEQFEAKVIGVAAREFNQSAYFVAGAYAAKLIEESREELKQQLAALDKQFHAAMKGRAKAVEWRAAVDFPTQYITAQTRAADLIIVGGAQHGSIDPWTRLDPGVLLMEAGRPLLVVPPEQKWLDERNALVAWKDTRESRRAIRDALPMLRKAKEVTVAEVVEDDDGKASAQVRVKDVTAWLARHNVQASAVVSRTQEDATDRIEQIASEVGATLVVAGAYGHARLREWAFGGVTKSLLTQTRRCVLMSH